MVATFSGCAKSPPVKRPPSIYASAEDVELNFRDRTFVLGDNNEIAEVRPLDWRKDKFLKLPFWFGVNILVPGVMAPKEGDFYVISEATLEKPLDTPGEWMIEAGSSLVKQETVFVTTRTQYSGTGKILPTIVQYIGKREFKRSDGKTVQIPVLREVSLPMKWTLGGTYPDRLREIPHMIRGRTIVVAIALTLMAVVTGCTPDKALDFGPVGEISTPPEDPLSRDIMRDFAGRDFNLGNNDHEAVVQPHRLEARTQHHHAVLARREPALSRISAPDRRTSICDEPIDAGPPARRTTST